MSGYSSAQEDVSDSKPALLMDQDMLVVCDDIHSAPRSGRESLDVSDDETSNQVAGQKLGEDATLEMKRIAFHKPSLSLTLMTEDEDGNVSLRTEEFEEDKHVTMMMDNEGSDGRTGEEDGTGQEEDGVQEDLGEALKDMKVMSSLMKSRKSTASSRSAGMKRWKGTIVNDSDSDDDDIVAKLSLMLLKSDETPVLTVPIKLEDGCLTDTENFED